MQISYRITEKDYSRAVWLSARPTKEWLTIYLIIIFVLIASAILGSSVVRAGSIGGLMSGSIVLICQIIYMPFRLRRDYRKYPRLHLEFKLELLNDGLRMEAPNAEAHLPWSHIVKWRHNKNYILIYRGPRIFNVLPKSIGSSGFDIPSLLDKLTQHVGKPR